MKRMKKLLAFLLAAMLLLTMIPISASAYNGDQFETYDAIEYQAFDHDMIKILHDHDIGVGRETEIEGVKVILNEEYTSQNELTFTRRSHDGTGNANTLPYFFWTTSGTVDTAYPGNIVSLVITYDGGQTLTVLNEDLRFTAVDQGREICSIKSNDTSESIVTFWYEPGLENTRWSLYDVKFVETGKAFDAENALPSDPVYSVPGSEYKFVNWDKSVSGGDPFLTYLPITEDTAVYAQKVSAETSGTVFHVINDGDTNTLFNRFLELYNAEHNTALTVDKLNRDKFTCSVTGDGKTTNDRTANRWEPLTSLGGELFQHYYILNTYNLWPEQYHIPFNEVESVTITGPVDGENESYTIPVDSSIPGAFSISLQNDNRADLTINPPLDPPDEGDLTDDPDDDNDPTYPIDGLDGTAVKIDCVNDTITPAHGDKTYGLLEGTFKVGNRYWVGAPETGYFAADITVDVDSLSSYIDLYDETTTDATHTAVEGQDDQTITLKLDGSEWVLEDPGEVPVTYQVECKTPDEPDVPGTEPDDPRKEDIVTNYGEEAVNVVCRTEPDNHKSATYNLTAEAIEVGEPYLDEDTDKYYCVVTISADSYVSQYKPEGVHHDLANESPDTGSFKLYHDGTKWLLAEDQNTPYVTFYVTCKDGGGEPGTGDDDDKTPDEPTQEELKDIIGNNDNIVSVECVNNKRKHTTVSESFGYLEGGLAINEVKTTGSGADITYTCEITIYSGTYINAFEALVGVKDAHKLAQGQEEFPTFTLTWDPTGVDDENGAWELPTNEMPVQIEVTCDVETVTTPGGTIVIEKDPEDPTDPDQTGVADLLETDDHIQYLFGYPDDSFGPDRNMTRAEAAQMFYNLLKNKNVDAEPAFDDVPDGAWYATPVNVMAELGIVNGVGDDKFEPNREITRAEFTTMAMRFAKVPSGGVNIFTDVNPDDWFYSYVVNSIQYGWIEGYGDGTFRPDRLITRAEVTTIVNRMLDRQADMAFVIQNRDKLTKFTDLTTEHWAYYTIVEATNEHNYKKPAIGEDWTSLKK